MATGTGKTLVSAAIIKLFLQTGNAKRVLFLVDHEWLLVGYVELHDLVLALASGDGSTVDRLTTPSREKTIVGATYPPESGVLQATAIRGPFKVVVDADGAELPRVQFAVLGHSAASLLREPGQSGTGSSTTRCWTRSAPTGSWSAP